MSALPDHSRPVVDREEAVTIMATTYGHRGLARMALDHADEIVRLRAENEALRDRLRGREVGITIKPEVEDA